MSTFSTSLCFLRASSFCLKYILLKSLISYMYFTSRCSTNSLSNFRSSFFFEESFQRASYETFEELINFHLNISSTTLYSNFLLKSSVFFCMEEFQWFLIELSVLPSRTFAISAHLFPIFQCWRKRVHSSSIDQFSFLILGFKWLCHLSLHCFPILPGRLSAMDVHFYGPFFSTKSSTSLSSSGVQGPFMSVGFNTFCHLCKHYTSVLPFKSSAIFFQFFASYLSTASYRRLSSSAVQCPLTLDLSFPSSF